MTTIPRLCPSLPVLLSVLVALLAARPAPAQQAPAGNAHPEQAAVSEDAAPSPFGDPTVPSTFTMGKKYAFSAAVDLSPLRDLAVLQGARVKILDTLARETVESITGRRRYVDYIHTAGGRVKDVKHDPLFPVLDMMIDPAYYADKPLVHAGYLPLRRAILESSLDDPEEIERWMRLTRLTPMMIANGHEGLGSDGAVDPAMMAAMEDAAAALRLHYLSHTNLAIVPPGSGVDRWRRADELPEDSVVRAEMLALGAAWRAGDATTVQQKARCLRQALLDAGGAEYPGFTRRLEAAYNRARPFEWGAWMYCAALVTLLLAFGTGRRWLIVAGVGALGAAVAVHALGFGARWAIAERLPIQNQFESMTGLALGGAIVALIIMLVKRQWLFGAAGALAGFLTLLAATQAGIPGESIGREAAILNTSVLLKYHVSTVLVSYGLITVGFGVSLFYLCVHYLARRAPATCVEGAGDAGALAAGGLGIDSRAGVRRILSDLDTAQMTVLQLGFWTLGVGILLGAWWADHSWGRWWAFDPKETWALITWIVYLIAIHVRFTTTRDRGLITAWLSVAGFVVMLWTYFGVNLLLPGLHAYA